MGSISDWKTLKAADDCLKEFGLKAHVEVVSAHRSPEKLVSFSKEAQGKGFKVIIAGAGGAAHLPGMVASLTSLPVIGVPIQTTALNGLDALLSIVQMPKGIPVATVAVDNSWNAGLLALRILSLENAKLKNLLIKDLGANVKKVAKMNRELKTKNNKTNRQPKRKKL